MWILREVFKNSIPFPFRWYPQSFIFSCQILNPKVMHFLFQFYKYKKGGRIRACAKVNMLIICSFYMHWFFILCESWHDSETKICSRNSIDSAVPSVEKKLRSISDISRHSLKLFWRIVCSRVENKIRF